jgi:putative DNA primase/helicase
LRGRSRRIRAEHSKPDPREQEKFVFLYEAHQVEEFLELLRSEGFEPGEVIADGKLHRFSADSDDKRKSAYYVLHRNYRPDDGTEYYGACYGSWKYGEPKKWCSLGKKIPKEIAATMKEQIRRAKEQAEKAREESFQEVAAEVQVYWDNLATSGDSPYLQRKGVSGDHLGIRFNGSCIYVPCRDGDGKLWSLEEVSAEGRKMSWPGGRRAGCFHLIGGRDSCTKIYLAEGFATAASIHLATGEAVACCFGSGQFEAIGKSLRGAYPGVQLVICGDLDKPGKTGGVHKAESAAKQLSVAVVYPLFKHRGDTDTDFNDLHKAEGLDTVRSQLSTELAPVRLSMAEIAEIPFPDEGQNGRRLGTIENVRELLKRLGIVIRYNGISKEQETLIPNLSTTMDNRENCTLAHLTSWCERCRIPTGNLQNYVTALSDQNLYNPVQTWIGSEAWDGKSRLREFYSTVQAPDVQLKELLMLRWLVSAVAAAYEPNGISAQGILVFQGDTGVGKTRWFRSLCPAELRLDGLELNPSDKDSVLRATSIWLGELGEIDSTFRKSDIAALKAFVTKDSDVIRLPYDRRKSKFARRTVYFGSVNDEEFLHDPTGNRRFWTVNCDKVDPDHTVDMQQLWAEVVELYRAGERWYLDKEEMQRLAVHNENFQTSEPLEEAVYERFDWADEHRRQWLSVNAVCKELNIDKPTIRDTRIVARTLQKASGRKKRKSNGHWVYCVAPILNNPINRAESVRRDVD